jgi:hypothetical protein
MQAYPPTLPAPLVSGYTLSPVDQTVRTDMEVGAARVRRRTRARNDLIDVSWLFSPVQMAAFRQWFEGYDVVRTNHLLYSNTFSDASWVKAECTSEIGQPDPFGGSLASLITSIDPYNTHFGSVNDTLSVAGIEFTFSVYLKLGSYTGQIILFLRDGEFGDVGIGVFTLSGAGTAVSSMGAASIINVGGGWYRCSISETFPTGSALGYRVWIDPTDTPELGETYSAYGAQFEYGGVATDYIATTINPVTDIESFGIAGGTSWFNMAMDLGEGAASTEVVRFKGPFKATRDSSMWRVTAQIEVR